MYPKYKLNGTVPIGVMLPDVTAIHPETTFQPDVPLCTELIVLGVLVSSSQHPQSLGIHIFRFLLALTFRSMAEKTSSFQTAQVLHFFAAEGEIPMKRVSKDQWLPGT